MENKYSDKSNKLNHTNSTLFGNRRQSRRSRLHEVAVLYRGKFQSRSLIPIRVAEMPANRDDGGKGSLWNAPESRFCKFSTKVTLQLNYEIVSHFNIRFGARPNYSQIPAEHSCGQGLVRINTTKTLK